MPPVCLGSKLRKARVTAMLSLFLLHALFSGLLDFWTSFFLFLDLNVFSENEVQA